jgi:hypothetical protein
MVKFVGKVFRGVFEVWLWLSLIIWVVLGGVGGFAIGGFHRSTYVFPGVIVGLILGFLITAVSGGLVAKFLEMCDNIQKLADEKKA